mmetsp:Transcript_4873/g.31176  ORF Transcript_4873/g.31176 Transcript_4873/m.31176 type:complete len:224 (+) Transcript_4873:320-991(+)
MQVLHERGAHSYGTSDAVESTSCRTSARCLPAGIRRHTSSGRCSCRPNWRKKSAGMGNGDQCFGSAAASVHRRTSRHDHCLDDGMDPARHGGCWTRRGHACHEPNRRQQCVQRETSVCAGCGVCRVPRRKRPGTAGLAQAGGPVGVERTVCVLWHARIAGADGVEPPAARKYAPAGRQGNSSTCGGKDNRCFSSGPKASCFGTTCGRRGQRQDDGDAGWILHV